MRSNSVMGFIFSNFHEEAIPELTFKRTMGSVPFGGKYRLIDFPLSNMVNSDIAKIGVATKSNYTSLMNHLGSGKMWNLSRRRGGLVLLPPFAENGSFNTRIEMIYALRSFLEHSTEEYVLICDCDQIYNISYKNMIKQHIESGADITIAYKSGVLPDKLHEPVIMKINNINRVTEILINPTVHGECNYALSSFLINRNLLLRLVCDCISKNQVDFKRDILQRNTQVLKINGYRFDGFLSIITSVKSYFDANMALMNADIRRELFTMDRPVFTKIRDDMPSKYGLSSVVKNSLVAQGCVIEGEVRNSILFKGVHIHKNVRIENCVIMQDTQVYEDSRLSYVICDKDVTVRSDRTVSGYSTYPVFIGKSSVV